MCYIIYNDVKYIFSVNFFKISQITGKTQRHCILSGRTQRRPLSMYHSDDNMKIINSLKRDTNLQPRS